MKSLSEFKPLGNIVFFSNFLSTLHHISRILKGLWFKVLAVMLVCSHIKKYSRKLFLLPNYEEN